MDGACLEGLYGDVAGVGVELLLRILIIVTLACEKGEFSVTSSHFKQYMK